MAPARTPAPGPSMVPLILVGTVAAAGAATWFGYPGLILLIAGIMAAAFSAPPALLTGKKDISGFPTAASPAETKAMNSYRMWGELKWRLLYPSTDWLPGWPLRLWWFASLFVSVAVAAIPTPEVGDWGRAANAIALFVTINTVNGALRRWTAPADLSPGPTADVLVKLVQSGPKWVAAVSAIGVLGIVTFLGVLITVDVVELGAAISPLMPWQLAMASALAVVATGAALISRTASLATWRTLVRVRAEWEPRWQIAKLDPAPRLLAHDEVGPIHIDTFESHPTVGSAMVLGLMPKVQMAMGAASKLAFLEAPAVDSQQQPIEGSKHPLRFRLVTFNTDELPDLNDPDVDMAQAELMVAAAASWTLNGAGCNTWVFLGLEPLHKTAADGGTGTTAAWVAYFAQPEGPEPKYMRDNLLPDMGGNIGAEALSDHKSNELYLGSLLGSTTDYREPKMKKHLADLATTDEWGRRWTQILKMGAVQPRPEHAVYAEAKVGNVTMYRQPFVVQQGMDPLEFYKLEPKIKTTLSAAPFVAVSGFSGQGDRAGERHGQAFCITWAAEPVPSNPDRLAPGGPGEGVGPRWVLQGRINEAFDNARLARPEISDAKPLTDARSRGHIWELKLRLYGGVTLSEVRGNAQKIRQSLGSKWLRVADAPDGCIIVVGVDPEAGRDVIFAKPEKRNRDYVTRLDWEQAFSDANVVGSGGILPKLIRSDVMKTNEQVQVLDFKLPTGTDRSIVKSAVSKLQTSTGNAFVEVRPSPDGADHVRVLVSREHPLPAAASVNWDAVDESKGPLYFATGVEGEPVGFDITKEPHVLVAGASGGGKSVSLQVLLYPAVVNGSEIYVIDPTKGGADFQFAAPYAKAFAATVEEAAAVMKAVYREVSRRKDLNAKNGVGGYRDLPEAIRPKHIYLVMDEFTSLMQADPVSKIASDDPEVERERELVVAANQRKAYIGTMTGKIAREARSAGVTLILATQKLSAKMLDDIPGAGDLKMLSLDSLLPVPVSERFPTGWARNADLEIGDLLYTPNSNPTPILGFSEVFVDKPMYDVTFDDGQVVRASGDHLWQASDERSRKQDNREPSTKTMRAISALAIADATADDTWASASELAQMLGYGSTKNIVRLADSFGTRRAVPDTVNGGVMPYGRDARRGAAAAAFHARTAASLLAASGLAFASSFTDLEFDDGVWLTARELTELATGEPVDARKAGRTGKTLRDGGCPSESREHPAYLYEVVPFLRAIAEYMTSLTAVDANTGATVARERIVTTDQMRESLNRRGVEGASNWAIRNAAPFDGPDADLAVDPYVLGAWLGDGSTGTGLFTSGHSDACTDVDGVTDQTHLRRQLDDAGFDSRVLPSHDNTVGTAGLKVKLRAVGVLDDKRIPAAYLRASYSQRLALLQGLMDTDGSAAKSGQCTIGLTKGDLAADVLELVRSLGIKASWYEWPAKYKVAGTGEYKVTGTVHTVGFRTNLPVFRLPRKLDRLVTLSDNSRTGMRFIRSIEPVPTEPARCIAVADDSHLFLVEGFIPTHNTNLARMLMGNATYGEKQSALKSPEEAPEMGDVIPKGRGLWESTEGNARLIQVWFEPSQETFAQKIAERREPLTDSEKLDLTPFLEKSSGGESEQPIRKTVVPAFPTQEPEIVTVADFEFTLDDLEASEVEIEPEVLAVPEPEGLAAPTISDDDVEVAPVEPAPLILAPAPSPDLDWSAMDDGVPAPAPAVDEDELDWSALLELDNEAVSAAEPDFDHVELQDAAEAPEPPVQFVDDGSVLVLLAPGAEVPDGIAPGAPVVMLPATHTTESDLYGWWKIDAAIVVTEEFPNLTTLVWVDADLAVEDELGIPHGEMVLDVFDNGIVVELVVPARTLFDYEPAAVAPTAPTAGASEDEFDFDAPAPRVLPVVEDDWETAPVAAPIAAAPAPAPQPVAAAVPEKTPATKTPSKKRPRPARVLTDVTADSFDEPGVAPAGRTVFDELF